MFVCKARLLALAGGTWDLRGKHLNLRTQNIGKKKSLLVHRRLRRNMKHYNNSGGELKLL